MVRKKVSSRLRVEGVAGRVPPKELLSQMEPDLLAQHDEEFVLRERPSRLSGHPCSTNHERTVVLEYSFELMSELLKPRYILLRLNIPIDRKSTRLNSSHL